MAAWVCGVCTAVYSVGAAECPQCGATEHVEEGQEMAKISKGDGPSYEPGRDPNGEPVQQKLPPEVTNAVDPEPVPEPSAVETEPAPAPAPKK